MKNLWKITFLITLLNSCVNKDEIDLKTYYLSYIDKFPDSNILTSDSLTDEQNQIIKKYNLDVYIPNDFKSVVDREDKDAFIFYNSKDSSLLLARCFDLNDTINKQIKSSNKINSPIYGRQYNDLSEFKHFKLFEKIITDSLIGPFKAGGTLFDLLGADNVIHKEFLPKSKKYKFGEFTILFDKNKYLFISSLHNGYSEDLDEKPRWAAFRFKSVIEPVNSIIKPIQPQTIDKVLEVYTQTSSLSNLKYTFIDISNFRYSIELKRPQSSNDDNLVCIPAAFTDLKTYNVDGVNISNGLINNSSKFNNTLTGLFYLVNNEVKIDDINKFDNKTDSLFELVKAQKESLIQQILLVKDGIAMKFSSKDKFQRRCICTKNDGGNFIIESLESITLSQFSIDLVALNIDAAIYTDMGSWDEGWYKSGPNLVKIGNSRKNTNKQCNWFLVKHK